MVLFIINIIIIENYKYSNDLLNVVKSFLNNNTRLTLLIQATHFISLLCISRILLLIIIIDKYTKTFNVSIWGKKLLKLLSINNNELILNILISLNQLRNEPQYSKLISSYIIGIKEHMLSPNEDIRTLATILYNFIK